MAHPVQPRPLYSQVQKQPCCLHPLGTPTHLPLSPAFLLEQNLSSRTLPEVTSQAQNLPTSIEVISTVVKGF